MPINVLFSGRPDRWEAFQTLLREGFEETGLDVHLTTEIAPQDVDYVIYGPAGEQLDFAQFTKTKAVLSFWAGVETIVTNKTLIQPLTRMVEEGLAQGMAEWVTAQAMRHHIDTDQDVNRAPGDWNPRDLPLASERPVTILGLGELGLASAHMLAGIGFPVTGWSRTQKAVDGISCLSGEEGLKEALKTAQILVLLLPDTPQTQNTLNADTLALLPKGAVIINSGRGTLINDGDLIEALDSGQVGHATLDVFRTEPLPKDHPFWTHPGVTISPHIAAETRPATAAKVLVENIRRSEAGEPLLHVVDRTLGY